MMDEYTRKAIADGYRAAPFSKPEKHGFKKWPDNYAELKAANTQDVKDIRARMIKNCGGGTRY